MANITVDMVLETGIEQLVLIAGFNPVVGVAIEKGIEITTPIPIWEGGSVNDYINFPTIDRNGVISGTVKVLGVLQNKAQVSLYFRKTGRLIQTTFTDASGVFSFDCGLNRNVSDYYAVAITEQPYNAQVFDKLTPA